MLQEGQESRMVRKTCDININCVFFLREIGLRRYSTQLYSRHRLDNISQKKLESSPSLFRRMPSTTESAFAIVFACYRREITCAG